MLSKIRSYDDDEWQVRRYFTILGPSTSGKINELLREGGKRGGFFVLVLVLVLLRTEQLSSEATVPTR